MSTKTKLLRTAVAFSLVLAFASSANAAIISLWTFETSLPNGTGATSGPWLAESGTAPGNATGVHANALTVTSNPSGNGSAESFSANTWGIGDYFQFQASTLGEAGILIEFDITRSSTGPTTWDLFWSNDGTNFTQILNDFLPLVNGSPNVAWSIGAGRQSNFTISQDLSTITALDNQAAVYFRIVNDITAAAGGTTRVDNFQISSVPEPTSMALAGVGLAGFVGNRLRRRKAAKVS